ncbi:FAD-dependent oxidoreductase [Amycolatopsis sp.]|jgi:D-amino-acid oxidase|uniref:FAD-dependent oxidoreductase n=1 Tax=Amycolatopsis sp. TaxID=37632 RepID=UPI002DF9C3E3|nr:FAD-dependent oxidoreductase [Amycolatopsis sp.]
MHVTVVGGGVIGLSCALRLAHAGNTVTLVTADGVADTTSAVAGGLIYPPGTRPFARCAGWTGETLAEFQLIGAPGVRFLRGRLAMPISEPWPDWTRAVAGVAREGDSFVFTTAVVDTPVYLEWLVEKVKAAGVRIEHRRVGDLLGLRADLVVNAAGLGGGALAGDDSVVPYGGQVVHLADPGLREWAVKIDGDLVTYVIPHGGHVVCGGTEERGRSGTEPDPEATREILRRCRELVPALEDAEVLLTKVGLRPHRPEVRLERVGDVIHCYGHGGAGITLSWGCADEVTELVSGYEC